MGECITVASRPHGGFNISTLKRDARVYLRANAEDQLEDTHDTLCVNPWLWLAGLWSGSRRPRVRPGPPRVKDAARPCGAGCAGPGPVGPYRAWAG